MGRRVWRAGGGRLPRPCRPARPPCAPGRAHASCAPQPLRRAKGAWLRPHMYVHGFIVVHKLILNRDTPPSDAPVFSNRSRRSRARVAGPCRLGGVAMSTPARKVTIHSHSGCLWWPGCRCMALFCSFCAPHTRCAPQRLMRDFKRLRTDPTQGVNGSPNPDNIMLWNAVIFGPEDTPWDGGELAHGIRLSDPCRAYSA